MKRDRYGAAGILLYAWKTRIREYELDCSLIFRIIFAIAGRGLACFAVKVTRKGGGIGETVGVCNIFYARPGGLQSFLDGGNARFCNYLSY